ncbi:MAG: Sensor histidine kinase TodS [Candidatus Ordinivivax streblomastigis]|uniref:histidine kinase n=1 Tax=Candidatus Ordinivivax streblomastigis TaxID=2540710 RepID=A0A5M8NZQ1_9BACT|nr:MAG: Sensor histidine kinase TodS [Candidatus Ordinivivax streblomastigis]
MKRAVLLFWFFLIFLFPAQCFYFRSYQVEDGLSHNSVWAVMQDKKGFMWFGTSDGLNRFDGKSFKIYKRKQGDSFSIGSSFIHCLKEDSRGRFLVGTKEGLYRFDLNDEKFYPVDFGINRAKEEEVSINAILEDLDGNIWLACHGQGVYVLNPDLTIKKHYSHDKTPNSIPSNFIWTIVQDNTGNIWLGSVGAGLIHFYPKKELFTKLDALQPLGIKEQTVFSLFCDMDNNIWIGTSSEGLYRYNYRTGKLTNYLNQQAFNIKSIIEYSGQELIMGSDKGLVLFNRTTETFEFLNNNYDNLTDNSIFSIVKDNEGAFWIGTYFGGVNYFSPAINKFHYYYNTPKNSSKKNIISSFAEDETGKIWIGTYSDGLSLFDPKTGRFESVHYNIGYHDIQDMFLDDNKLYISLYGKGLSCLDVKTGSVSRLFENRAENSNRSLNFITSIFKNSTGNFFFGSEVGVSIFNPKSKSLSKIDYLSNIPIKSIKEDDNGNIWIATHTSGLLRLDAAGNRKSFTHDPKDASSLPTNNINCVFQDSKLRIWVGTESEGLLLFNPKNDKFDLVFSEASGLPSNTVYSILDDNENNIWVTTSGGLVKINTESNTIKTFGYIGDIQKIRYNFKSALRASDNRLYFGGTNGFIAFDPKEIDSNQQIPQVVITGFQLSNKEVVSGDKFSPLKTSINKTESITLNYDQSTFCFDFVALSYLSPDHNQYAYRLEGLDKDWNYVSSGTKACYMNIPAGEYVFRVKGSNNDGVWNETGVSIILKINPPFWFAGYMIVLYVLLVLALCVYAIVYYHKRLNANNQEKIYKYKVEKEKETYESKINFFTNVAHEIRTPLSLIIAPLENILLSGDGTPQTKSNLEIMEINANRLLDLINQLLDFRKIEENMFQFNFRKKNVVKIVRDVYNQYAHSAKQNHIDLLLSVKTEPIESVVDPEAIYKIVSNLVSNAVKYANKKIEIKVGIEDEQFFVSVQDDGVGLDKIYLDRIFEPFFQVQDKGNAVKTGSGLGLSLSQSLSMKHNGKIQVESEQGKGSLFTLRIPMVTSLSETAELNEEESLLFEQSFPAETGLRILIVEDNKDLRTFLSSSIGENNTVFEAENGIKALELIEKEHLDIIISDILMPEMNGLELCDALKTNLAYSHIPLMLLSAKTDTSTKIEGLQKGADVYLEKPFSIEQLKAQINSIIENRNNLRNNFIQSPLQYYSHKVDNDENAKFIERLNTCIIENMSDEKFTIDSLSGQFFMSRSNFHKKIKTITGITPNEYIKLIRLNQSAQMLNTGKYKINEVCYLVGFNTPSYFSKCFYEHFGKLPKDFIQIKNDK